MLYRLWLSDEVHLRTEVLKYRLHFTTFISLLSWSFRIFVCYLSYFCICLSWKFIRMWSILLHRLCFDLGPVINCQIYNCYCVVISACCINFIQEMPFRFIVIWLKITTVGRFSQAWTIICLIVAWQLIDIFSPNSVWLPKCSLFAPFIDLCLYLIQYYLFVFFDFLRIGLNFLGFFD